MSAVPPPDRPDYKATVFLPKTDFPMRGNLAVREPEILAYWQKIDLYRRLREDSGGREKFVVHDGPPYANGHLHHGHGLNKILKDIINRTQQMLGRNATYVPGWDCHGLPIEWKIEEQYRAQGQDKAAVPTLEFRAQCRAFALSWIDIQREEFQRLGVIGDWHNPYTTMDFAAEAQIFREFTKFLMDGSLYQGARPVLWSVVEQTALADAEVEYHDHLSTAIHVRFPVLHSLLPELAGAAIVTWTTTPWTLPGNRAVAYHPELIYAVIEVKSTTEGAGAVVGERLVMAKSAIAPVLQAAGVCDWQIMAEFPGTRLADAILAHPWRGRGYEFDVPLIAGSHVTDDTGSGLVHTAPGHGLEDFEATRALDIEIPHTVAGDGLFYPSVPLFAGLHVFRADEAILAALTAAGALLAQARLQHSYPHSWRSRAPLIFRNTPQWFISMDKTGLRAKALAAIDATRWVPAGARNRLRAMIEQRPDWCISRQRSWGVPLAVFVAKASGEVLRDASVNQRIFEAFAAEGGDAWFASPPERFLGPNYRAEDYEQIKDVLEVWFDSGSSHSYVLEARPDLKWPADLYLEGSDQHRGFFHTSLLESCGTRGRAPFDAVLTHGFVLDEQGHKMSKSKGNVTSPQAIAGSIGIDILRLWVVGSDYSEDLRVGPEILKFQADHYRRLRNSLRYLLGALDGFTDEERVMPTDSPELERWLLHRLAELDISSRAALKDYDLHGLYNDLHHFCALDLSAFYFDIRKDSLYCDAPGSLRRRAVRTALAHVFEWLVAWLAPVLAFTTEEAWMARPLGLLPGAGGGGPEREGDSIHRCLFPETPAHWHDPALGARWAAIREIRRCLTGAIEKAREKQIIGSSLQAWPTLYVTPEQALALEGVDMAEIAIVSGIELCVTTTPPADEALFRWEETPGIAVKVARAEATRCERCWKILPEVGRQRDVHLCARCDDAIPESQP